MKKIIAITLILIMALLCSCSAPFFGRPNTAKTEDENSEIHKQEIQAEITLFYADTGANGLVAETRMISQKHISDAKEVLAELLKGPQKDGLVNAIPQGTRINSVTSEAGVCIVDFTKDFVSESGTASEQLAIYSVVNTLCGIDGIDSVLFKIDGQKVMIFGSYIFDEPFRADMSIVK